MKNLKKKGLFSGLMLSALILASCSSDDDATAPAPEPPVAESNIVLSEIEYLGNRVELQNAGSTAANVEDYFLCLGPGTYRRVGDLNIVSGGTTIQPGGYLVVTYDQLNTTAGQINSANA
ncbi:hypothetical protein GTQ40_16940, partial [Flavobacteriaceae bacterium R38]|nr:hypothetical protein [Flavobacteriaceae bacterium R38]